jgi:cysteine desulfurase
MAGELFPTGFLRELQATSKEEARIRMQDVIYLDNNAGTACDPRVVEAMLPYFTELGANPASRSHALGGQAYTALEQARTDVAGLLGARRATEITFLSGATEANNLALRGMAETLAGRGHHIVTQVTEHSSVLAPLRLLAKQGWEVTEVGVEADGTVRRNQLQAAIRADTVLVSLMLANNETGTIQPVAEVSEIAHAAGALVHCDAAQGVGKIPVDVARLGVDMLTLSGHKMHGPKGIGALYLRRQRPPLRPVALLCGGGQEDGLRSGTVNLPGVIGLARAMAIAAKEGAEERQRIAVLRVRLESGICGQLDGVYRNGCVDNRLPGTSNLSFAGVDGNALIAALPDLAISSGSACTSSHPEPSYVLAAMGRSRQLAQTSLRLGLGRFTTEEEVDRAVVRVVEEVMRLRHAR